jgi:tetratricopeptide (TPR) repeat protein
MQSKEPARRGNSRLYGTLLIVLAVMLAVFWSVHAFFMWALVGALTLVSLLYYRSLPKTERDYRYQREEEERAARKPTEPKQSEARASDKPRTERASKRGESTERPTASPNVLRWLAIGFFGVIALMVLAAVVFIFIPLEDEQTDYPPNEKEAALATLTADPNNIDALTNAGNYHFELQEYDSALAYYERVLRVDSRNSTALYNKGLVFYRQARYEESIPVLRLSLDIDPANTGALQVMGNNYYDRQLYGPALEWYQKAYDLGARDGFLCHALGWLYDDRNQTSRAIPFYKEALSLDSARADIYTRLAELEPQRATEYRALEARWKQDSQ